MFLYYEDLVLSNCKFTYKLLYNAFGEREIKVF